LGCQIEKAVDELNLTKKIISSTVYGLSLDVLQLSGWLAGGVKESRNDNPTRDLQMGADRTRTHPLRRPVVSSLFSFATRC
jgi:hypothetical protein